MLKLTEYVIQWIKEYYSDNPDGKAIIGISGGKDSTICAALLVEALGKDRVIGVLMPRGEQKDIEDSYKVCQHLGIHHVTIDIDSVCTILTSQTMDAVGYPQRRTPDEIRTNLPARIRMTTLYTVCAMYRNSRVVNTSNFSERFVGYSTKFGDGVGDFSPLGGLLVKEVLAIGDDLGLPHDLVHKAPSDGMSGKTDEDNLGFTYEQLDAYLTRNDTPEVSEEIKDKIRARWVANKHKLDRMPTFGIPYIPGRWDDAVL